MHHKPSLAGFDNFKELKKLEKLSDNHLALFMTMNLWVKAYQKNRKLSEYFVQE